MGFGSNEQRGAERCRGVMDKKNNEYPTQVGAIEEYLDIVPQ